MKILILEDEPLAAKRLESLVKSVEPTAEILAKLESVRSAVKWFNEHPQPDLVLMDIQLADGLSFELFQQVDVKAPIIFTTAYDEYAIRAFKVNSVDYLLKPIESDELEAAIDKFKSQQPATSQDQIGKVLETLLGQKTEWKTRFLLKAGASKGDLFLITIAALNMIIALYYYLRVIKAMFMEENEESIPQMNSGWPLKCALAVCLIGILFTGFSGPIYEYIFSLSRGI